MSEEKKVLLHCEHLVKEFPVSRTKSVHAVSDIDLEIYEGECLALVGESGCGKSTLGRTLIQLHKPTSGDVWYKDVKISAMKPAEFAPYRRQMQMIFQDPYASLDPRMNVRDIIAEPLVTYKVCENKEALTKRVLELMDAVGVPRDFLYRYPHQFSGGQRQRIGIARAIALHPSLVICDEPVSALDVSIQAQVVNMFEDLQQEMGLTYLFIAHDLSVVKHISNRIGVMYLGKMVELADSYELITHSIHPYTRSLISAIPVADPITARQSKRIVLQGDVPSPLNPPSGCRFRTRCPYADEQCANEVPEFKEVSTGHWAACHHLDRVK